MYEQNNRYRFFKTVTRILGGGMPGGSPGSPDRLRGAVAPAVGFLVDDVVRRGVLWGRQGRTYSGARGMMVMSSVTAAMRLASWWIRG